MSEFKLLPYKLNEVVSKVRAVPTGVDFIQAPLLWKQGIRGNDVVVAVLDSGCQMDHPDLKSRIIGGYNFTPDHRGNAKNFSDNNGHGTHVCGIIAAEKNSNIAIGVAPKAKLLVLKVLRSNGSGDNKWAIRAINYAINWRGPNGERVRVISMSSGGADKDSRLYQAVKDALSNNIVFVCAAGNYGNTRARNLPIYPGAFQGVIQVGSINMQGEISNFSNSNSEIDIFAPGENILSTSPNSGYAVMSGTSMATPLVSGAIALLIQYYEEFLRKKATVNEIYKTLMKCTVELPSRHPKQQGYKVLKLFGKQKRGSSAF